MVAMLATVVSDPARLAKVDPTEVPELLGALETIRARLLLRLQTPVAAPSEQGGEALLTAQEVAERIGAGVQRVWELCRDGRLPCIRVGRQVRIAPSALAKWIANGGQR